MFFFFWTCDPPHLSCGPFKSPNPHVGNQSLSLETALQPLYRECDSAPSVSCGDIWSCLCFDPLYPNNPNCCVSPRSPCLWCTYAHWPEHAGIRAGVLFYDWVTALTSCLVIRSVLISLPCWKQLSLSPRLVWSCGLSLLWFFLSVTYWEHWGPLTWWGCTMGAIKCLSVQVFLKEVF